MIWFHTAQHIKDIIMSKKYSINKVNGRNAFEVMGYVANAMKDCKMSRFDITDYQKEAMSDSYEYLIEVSVYYLNKCNKIAEGRV